VAVPNVSSQETDVYFQGETVEKIGPKKYKITNGGFTTCVQPTPRWELHAGTVVLSIDNYTLLRSAVFSVDYVPPANQLELGTRLVADYHIQKLTSCSTCHR